MVKPLRPWHRLASFQQLKTADSVLRVGVGHSLAVSCVQASGVVNTAAERWALTPHSAAAFARHAVHNIMHTSFFKGDERMHATISAPGYELAAESNKKGETRGYSLPANAQTDMWAEDGAGTMQVLKYLTNARAPHTTAIAFDGGVDGAWQSYFECSEMSDVASLVQVHTDAAGTVQWAGGLSVQAVAAGGGIAHPGSDSGAAQLSKLREQWRGSSELQAAMGDTEDTEERLMRAVSTLVADPLDLTVQVDGAEYCKQAFYCPCNLRDHATFLFNTLGAADLRGLVSEPETVEAGGVSLDCHMCNTAHLVPTEVLLSKCKTNENPQQSTIEDSSKH